MGAAALERRKRELRTYFRNLRKELGEQARNEADALISAGVLSLPEYAQASILLCYLDFGAEVRTRDIICQAWAAGKLVVLPWCVPNTHELRWFEVENFSGLVKSPLGVEEPNPAHARELTATQIERAGTQAFCLVPGLVFDEQGYRMGYGGGYYDSFLATFTGVSVGLCREVQMAKSLGSMGVLDAHDCSVNMVVTDERIIRI